MWQAIVAFLVGAMAAGVVAWWVVVREGRRRIQTDRKLLRRTRRAEKLEKLAELGVLTGHLAHEIRNPLSTIKVNLQLLSEDIGALVKAQKNRGPGEDVGGEEQVQSYQRQLRKIETVIKETDRLAEKLSDFLRYAGRMEMHPIRCDVNEIVDDLIDFYRPQALSKQVYIRESLSKTAPICRVDEDFLKQALLNLFINAAQAMESNGGGDLIVRSTVRGDEVEIAVIDTGEGIAADEQEKIFDAYFTTRPGGTGLGLPTCRRIIEEHEGHIDLHSEEGKGTSFTIVLPLAKA